MKSNQSWSFCYLQWMCDFPLQRAQVFACEIWHMGCHGDSLLFCKGKEMNTIVLQICANRPATKCAWKYIFFCFNVEWNTKKIKTGNTKATLSSASKGSPVFLLHGPTALWLPPSALRLSIPLTCLRCEHLFTAETTFFYTWRVEKNLLCPSFCQPWAFQETLKWMK